MKKITSVIALVLVCVFALDSCALLFTGSTSDVLIDSDPQGAVVTIDGVKRGYTPLTVGLDKDENHYVTVSCEGYKDGYANITKKVSGGWIVLDFLGSFVALLVDGITGSWYKLRPNQVLVVLEPET